jgi:WD40 repeat protein
MVHLTAWLATLTGALLGATTDEPQAQSRPVSGWVSAAFSADGHRFVTVSGGSPSYHDTVRGWDAATGKELLAVKNLGRVSQVLFSPDGKLIYGAVKDKQVKAWDAATGAERRTFGPHLGDVNRILLSPDGKLLYAVSDDGWPTRSIPDRAEIIGWDTQDGTQRFVVQAPGPRAAGGPPNFGPKGAISALTVSPDGKWLAAITFDPSRTGQVSPTARVWEAGNGKEVQQFRTTVNPHRGGLAFSPDGQHLALICGPRLRAQIRDVASGRAVQDIPIEEADNDYDMVAFSPDGKTLAVKAALTVDLYDVATGKRLHRLKQGTNVHGIAFSPDGKTLAAACGGFNEIYGSTGHVKRWEVTTGKLLSTHDGHRGYVKQVVFSPDGKRFAAINQVSVVIWNVPR